MTRLPKTVFDLIAELIVDHLEAEQRGAKSRAYVSKAGSDGLASNRHDNDVRRERMISTSEHTTLSTP